MEVTKPNMYSMNYIGKFIANFRDFYNEINAATLTGAIDVVVVEQADGSFKCSPFHVRFGKLGVLRSRFKVVDLELNGDPLNIHMKLGESGEAFFVEEVGEDEEECSARLATSPIPAGHFDQLYEPRRRNSLSVVEPDHGQASDYTKRRYTADAQSMQKPNISKLLKKDTPPEDLKRNSDIHDHDALFEMEGLNEDPWSDSKTPKTFSATKLGPVESEANQTVQKISAHNDFRPIEVSEDIKQNSNGKKKKKTRKVGSKKKHQRKSSSSSVSSQSDRAGSEQRTPQSSMLPSTNDFFSDSEVNASISEEMSKMNLSGDNRIPMALSDTAFEVHAASRHSRSADPRSSTPVQSDTEVELARASGAEKSSQSWRWGELPEPPVRGASSDSPATPPSPVSPASEGSPKSPASPIEPLSSDEERGTGRRGVLSGMFRFMARETRTGAGGVYLDELDGGKVDPDLYFPKHHADQYRAGMNNAVHAAGPTEEEYESGNGPSLPQSPASLEPPVLYSDEEDNKLLSPGQIGIYVREEGVTSVSRAIEYEEFCLRGCELLSEGRLLVRLGDRYLPWRSAGPLILSQLVYKRPLPNRMLEALEKDSHKEGGGSDTGNARTDNAANKSRYSWWSWRRTNVEAKRIEASPPKDASKDVPKELSKDTPKETDVTTVTAEVTAMEAIKDSEEERTPTSEEVDTMKEETDAAFETVGESDAASMFEEQAVIEKIEELVVEEKVPEQAEAANHSSSESDEPHAHGKTPRRQSVFRKSLRLSSEQIKKLNLRVGMNEMVFSVTTAYQGTTRCKCNVFRWRYDDKIVISDIDGTITKSDVLGHIFPLVGKDWAQSGVAQLFTKIKNNGYQLLYLSARAIGQARVTREYLRSIRQGELCLPDGPLLLNPTSLLRAFHREVIEKKPEEFKIHCLADIKALFPAGSNPFYAGYGNRINDVCAYQAVGIPIVRIFTINYKGELKHELTQTFQSTYSNMSVLVDEVFPPTLCDPTDEFSQIIFWREPLLEIEEVPTTTIETQKK